MEAVGWRGQAQGLPLPGVVEDFQGQAAEIEPAAAAAGAVPVPGSGKAEILAVEPGDRVEGAGGERDVTHACPRRRRGGDVLMSCMRAGPGWRTTAGSVPR